MKLDIRKDVHVDSVEVNTLTIRRSNNAVFWDIGFNWVDDKGNIILRSQTRLTNTEVAAILSVDSVSPVLLPESEIDVVLRIDLVKEPYMCRRMTKENHLSVPFPLSDLAKDEFANMVAVLRKCLI